MEQLFSIINSGKIFSIKFRKKDGSIRVANCKNFVKTSLRGGKRTLPKDFIVLVDRNKMDKTDNNNKPFISMKLESILEVNCGKIRLVAKKVEN